MAASSHRFFTSLAHAKVDTGGNAAGDSSRVQWRAQLAPPDDHPAEGATPTTSAIRESQRVAMSAITASSVRTGTPVPPEAL
jgi:hypothetical protein